MKRLALSLAAAVAILGGTASSTLAYDWTAMDAAQNNVYTSTTQLPLVAIGDCNGDIACGACDDCCDCCLSWGFIGSAELTYLKPHFSLGTGAGDDFDWDYQPSVRLVAGLQRSDGLGVRFRYWDFDHTQADPGGAVSDSQSVETYILDLEAFTSMQLGCNWDATISSGLRYLEYAHERAILAGLGQRYENSSIGMTVSGELRYAITGGLTGFINSRASVLFGDEDELDVVGPGVYVLDDREFDNIYSIYEAQSGVQWTRPLDYG
jgi:hypothetical protein